MPLLSTKGDTFVFAVTLGGGQLASAFTNKQTEAGQSNVP